VPSAVRQGHIPGIDTTKKGEKKTCNCRLPSAEKSYLRFQGTRIQASSVYEYSGLQAVGRADSLLTILQVQQLLRGVTAARYNSGRISSRPQ